MLREYKYTFLSYWWLAPIFFGIIFLTMIRDMNVPIDQDEDPMHPITNVSIEDKPIELESAIELRCYIVGGE